MITLYIEYACGHDRLKIAEADTPEEVSMDSFERIVQCPCGRDPVYIVCKRDGKVVGREPVLSFIGVGLNTENFRWKTS